MQHLLTEDQKSIRDLARTLAEVLVKIDTASVTMSRGTRSARSTSMSELAARSWRDVAGRPGRGGPRARSACASWPRSATSRH